MCHLQQFFTINKFNNWANFYSNVAETHYCDQTSILKMLIWKTDEKIFNLLMT
jgi:hypothetical protein